jgi:organic hydroperoxide reductase OsmC/OhrA
MGKQHNYSATIKWTGNNGDGTRDYSAYSRSHTVSIAGKPDLQCSSDAPFRGDGSMHNPEDLLVASISACHMLWYLHLCADAGIVVVDYADKATGIMEERPDGGRFTEVTLHPVVTVTDSAMITKADELHAIAHKKCFIANSVNFPVHQKPTVLVKEPTYTPF